MLKILIFLELYLALWLSLSLFLSDFLSVVMFKARRISYLKIIRKMSLKFKVWNLLNCCQYLPTEVSACCWFCSCSQLKSNVYIHILKGKENQWMLTLDLANLLILILYEHATVWTTLCFTWKVCYQMIAFSLKG